MLKILHSSHLGQEKCIQREKLTVFWPGIIAQLKERIEQCNICNRYRNAQQKEPMIPHDVLSRSWQKVAADIMFFRNSRYLITVDYFSKFIEVNHLSDGKATTVINILKQHFARLGIPEEFMSDNGPEFANHEFRNFAKEYNFRHVTSSPRYPQSNGVAEIAVQTIKKPVQKGTG
jgi:transposase InsO family protein